MRFITRLAVSVATTALFIAGALFAPSAANASAPTYSAPWGPYYSSDHRAEASGSVSVSTEKVWYWQKTEKKCSEHDGKMICKDIKLDRPKWVWKFYYVYPYKVRSKLSNFGWKDWRNKCAWEKFKVETLSGHTYYRSFKNCFKFPKWHSFDGKDAKTIYVQVSRGNDFGPKGYFGGWEKVYEAV